MEIEEKDGYESYPNQSIPENQRENANSQKRNNERKPTYHATREGGYQTGGEGNNRIPAGRRPRIKDNSRNTNYNRPSYKDAGYPYPPQSSGREGRPSYPPRPVQPYGNSERREYTPYPSHPNAPERGYQNRERPRGIAPNERGNRPQPQGYRPQFQNARPPAPGSRPAQAKRPQQRPDPNAKYTVRKQIKYKEALTDPNEPIRLNKFLANAGVCSRREADGYIQAGVVKVNGNIITELGTKITRLDTVLFHDRQVKIEGKLYVLLNKPKNCVTTSEDPQERRTVMDLVKSACKERIYPIGRLDRNTTGVLLLTNDGDLASKLTHPSYKKKKIYHVWLEKEVAIEDMEKLANGIHLDDGEIHADAISYANEDDKKQIGIEIHSGRNRIVRRMFESLNYRVIKLDRVYFAGLTKKNLPRGKWRYLNEKEVNMLRMGAFE